MWTRLVDRLFKDDRLTVLELAPDTLDRLTWRSASHGPGGPAADGQDGQGPWKGSFAWPTRTVWAVLTRRNVQGYPIESSAPFASREAALEHYREQVVRTARQSLGRRAPSPLPSLGAYTEWLVANGFHDPVLNPSGRLPFDSVYTPMRDCPTEWVSEPAVFHRATDPAVRPA